jgi:Mn-dependent DtxR family transcriptional regulator
MLEKLLTEIRTGRTHSINDLAVKMNTTPALIQVLLEHLTRLGLVKQYQSCGDTCSGCSAKNLCKNEPSDRTNHLFYIETVDIATK